MIVLSGMRKAIILEKGIKFHYGMWIKGSNKGSRFKQMESSPKQYSKPSKEYFNARARAGKKIFSSSFGIEEDQLPHIREMREIEEEMALYGVSTVEELAIQKDLEYNKERTLFLVLVKNEAVEVDDDCDRRKVLEKGKMDVQMEVELGKRSRMARCDCVDEVSAESASQTRRSP
ncbi:hypothetical protein TorRG33x02_130110 [Trema orientale]|uniref:Uncharacterized protein n=1 Tax=Trema orientale TaxID=63057 RepID=A0A2P5F095_TREOI|nr:hypothetical protein TorRG33x02_130110 [Trema orientale]